MKWPSTRSRRGHLALAAAIASLALLAGGCRSIAPGRMLDLGDCGTFGVGVGAGLDATVQAGALAEASLGIGHDIQYFGWNGDDGTTDWRTVQLAWPVHIPMTVILQGMWGSGPNCCAAPFDAFLRVDNPDRGTGPVRPGNRPSVEYGKHLGYALPLLSERGRRRTGTFHNATRIEAEATLGVVSVRAGLNPLEILDFLLGFLGFDIAGDDPPRGDGEDLSHAESAESAAAPSGGPGAEPPLVGPPPAP